MYTKGIHLVVLKKKIKCNSIIPLECHYYGYTLHKLNKSVWVTEDRIVSLSKNIKWDEQLNLYNSFSKFLGTISVSCTYINVLFNSIAIYNYINWSVACIALAHLNWWDEKKMVHNTIFLTAFTAYYVNLLLPKWTN